MQLTSSQQGNESTAYNDSGIYTAELIVPHVDQYLTQRAADQQPFFLYLPWHLIHGPNQVRQQRPAFGCAAYVCVCVCVCVQCLLSGARLLNSSAADVPTGSAHRCLIASRPYTRSATCPRRPASTVCAASASVRARCVLLLPLPPGAGNGGGGGGDGGACGACGAGDTDGAATGGADGVGPVQFDGAGHCTGDQGKGYDRNYYEVRPAVVASGLIALSARCFSVFCMPRVPLILACFRGARTRCPRLGAAGTTPRGRTAARCAAAAVAAPAVDLAVASLSL